MKFWEDFFSTDKIIYPSIAAIIGGLFAVFGSMFLKISISDVGVGIFMGLGFIGGNILKTYKLQEIRANELSKSKKINKKLN